jgi:hypothetical protein
MTTLREAAQQALEALEAMQSYATAERKGLRICDESITSLKTALEQPTECWWFQDGDEDSGTYMASCNQRYFVLEDGTPTDNRMKHCCYCGKPLVEVPIEPEDNHD